MKTIFAVLEKQDSNAMIKVKESPIQFLPQMQFF